MTPDLYWIPGPWKGHFAIITRPRGGEWLQDEAKGWKSARLDLVVSLLEPNEAAQLSLDLEAETAEAIGVKFLSYPVPDRGIPASVFTAQSMLMKIKGELELAHNVAVHCRQGVGRSGLVAAGVLVASGFDAARAVEIVSRARGVAIPETPDQLRWIQALPAFADVR